MTWFKVDDQFATHPKALRAGNAACGLWVRAGSWSAAQLTGGHIPAEMVAVLGGKLTDSRSLVDVVLWHREGHNCPDCPQPVNPGGFVFHQWHENGQPTRAAVEERRSQWRESKARSRGSKSGAGLKVVPRA